MSLKLLSIASLLSLLSYIWAPWPPPGGYTSDQDGQWSNSTTWQERGTPGCSTNRDITIDGDTVTCNCDPLKIKGSGSITIKNGGSFSLNGQAEVTDDLSVTGDASASGPGTLAIGGTGCGDFSGADCSEGTALPVELTGFTVSKTKDQQVQISWSTASETNCDYFRVERSSNGIDFEPLDKVQGAGTTSHPQEYAITDPDPVEGTSYYRLRQTDLNGKTEVYDMVAISYTVTEEGECELKVYPNPCPGTCRVALENCPESQRNEPFRVELYDLMGNKVNAMMNPLEANETSSLHMDIGQNLTPGIYIIQAKGGNKIYQEKVKAE